jgi:drug/metabolite transporter (DMT)-like permease
MNKLASIVGLIGVALVWGVGFVYTKDAIAPSGGPITFIAWRFWLASLVLILFFPKQTFRVSWGAIGAGSLIGLLMGVGYCFQTIGLKFTTNGNTAFITGLHVVLIPVFSAWLLRRPPKLFSAIGVGIAAVGLGFLSLGSDFQLNTGDLWVMACAVVFALQIIAIAYFVQKYNATTLAVYQVYIAGLVATIGSYIFEDPQLSLIPSVLFELGFTGILGTAVAFSVLTHAQKILSPTKIGLLVILESPFGAFFGWLLAGEVMGLRELFGCFLILSAMILSEVGIFQKK